jgi:hypothetical protein
MAARKREPLVATSTFEAEVKGERVLVHAGDTVPATSPVAKGRQDLFVRESEYAQSKGTPPRTVG